MENGEGPDRARRRELLVKVRELMRLCGEIIRMRARSWAPGQRQTWGEEVDQLSPEAKRLFCELGINRDRAEQISETAGQKFEKWLKCKHTEGYPIPGEFTEIVGLIDQVGPSAG